MKKLSWETKEKINEALKVIVLITVMTFGFWFNYSFIWFAIGLPQTSWALLVTLALAIASEYGYFKWLEN